MTRLTRISFLLAGFFALDKGVAILRQIIIARQFGLSAELDAFNVANNVPDLLFALISGGALAMAIIPVLSETLTRSGRETAWRLFSNIGNLAFVATALLAVVIALFAGPLVRAEVGIAPGFGPQQQSLVITLMRINLIATLIFSLSGLVMAGLQANQHFLLPALAPLLYNLGQIFGALVLAPEKGYTLAGVTLPAFNLGVYGLVYGVILGAALHLGIQLPGLLKYKFRWTPEIHLRDAAVRQVLRVLGPRLFTVFTVQLIFIVRDNLASRLTEGSVTALTLGWMIQQVPETLIGTAIATAILPTLSELVTRGEADAFRQTIERAVRIDLGLALPVGAALAVGVGPLVQLAFGFDVGATDLVVWTVRGYLAGLIGHCLLEVASRSFYAQQDAITPLFGSLVNLTLYIGVGSLLYRPLGAPGVSLTDSLAFTAQALFLLALLRVSPARLNGFYRRFFRPAARSGFWGRVMAWLVDQEAMEKRRLSAQFQPEGTLLRAVLAALLAGLVTTGIMRFSVNVLPGWMGAALAMAAGGASALPLVWKEIRILLKF